PNYDGVILVPGRVRRGRQYPLFEFATESGLHGFQIIGAPPKQFWKDARTIATYRTLIFEHEVGRGIDRPNAPTCFARHLGGVMKETPMRDRHRRVGEQIRQAAFEHPEIEGAPQYCLIDGNARTIGQVLREQGIRDWTAVDIRSGREDSSCNRS